MKLDWTYWNGVSISDDDRDTMARKCIKYLRKHKKRYFIMRSKGNAAVVAMRDDDGYISVYDTVISRHLDLEW
jgi:hypothetical protein